MLIRQIFPFTAAPNKTKQATAVLTDPGFNPAKLMKVKVVGLDFNMGGINSFSGRAAFEESGYPFDTIIEAIDTDTYVKQGFMKYSELCFKEGWEIISENPEAVEALWQRLDFISEVMKRPFNDFLIEAVDQLVKFSNVFIVESRGDIAPLYPGTLKTEDDRLPIAGYYIIPTETVRIKRNRNNIPLSYRQSLIEGMTWQGDANEPTWSADEVIHMYLDKKPGRPFGTPMIIGALDDVRSLRTIEENVLNLINNEINPIYKYKVGLPDKPSTPEEVAQVAAEIEDLRTGGGLVMPERHDVEVVGSQGTALQVEGYLSAFKERLAVGMGMSPHHLGMLTEGGNRSVTDRLDIALYDKVKKIQRYVENMITQFIFNPLLREMGFDPLMTPKSDSQSDRCIMRFREIDTDTQIKIQTHEIQKFTNNLATIEETRIKLGDSPDFDSNGLLATITAQLQTMQQLQLLDAQAALTPAEPGSTTTTTKSGTATSGASKTVTKQAGKPAPKPLPSAVKKPDAINPSAGGSPNQRNNKGVGNQVRPSNQHGRRNSPNVRHMDDDVLNDIIELLGDDLYNE